MKPLILTIFLFSLTLCSAQEELVKVHNVYFDKDEYTILSKSKENTLSFIGSIKSLSIIKVEVVGHTDSDGTIAYNEMLSEKRARAVKTLLLQNGLKEPVIKSMHKGEVKPVAKNSTAEGQQLNRRVEIKVFYKVTPKPKIEKPKVVKKRNECEGDTLIELENGTLVKINTCAFLKNPDCANIEEFTNASSLADGGVSTRSEDGDILISGGMLRFDICEGVKVIAYMPYRENCMGDGMSLWDVTEDGAWRERDEPLELTEINGRRYYPIALSGSGFINIDKLPVRRLNKIKFKSKQGVRLQTVSLYCDCPMWGTSQEHKNRWRKKVVLRTTCCVDPLVSIVAKDEDGNLITITNRKLSEFEPANFLGNCRTDVRNSWWFFKIWNKSMYKKYKIRPRDFNLKEENRD